MNPKRKVIWGKSGGKCWYCGRDLPVKGWHADHFEPIKRLPDLKVREFHTDSQGRLSVTERIEKREPLHPERDHIDNLVPSCQSCNTLKGMDDIEGFRETIKRFVNSLNRYSVQYKVAKKYGLIEETDTPVVFWFEKEGKEAGSREASA